MSQASLFLKFMAITTTHPIPEAQHVGGVDAETGDGLSDGRHRDKVPVYHALVARLAQAPRAGQMGVGQRLLRCEGFRTDEKQCLLGVEIARGFREIRIVDVRGKARCHVALVVMTRRFVSHRRAETEASDADIALLERSASLSHIDCCASEHGIDRLREAAFASKLPEVRGRPVDHPVLQVVEVKTGCVDAQALAPPGSLPKSCRRRRRE